MTFQATIDRGDVQTSEPSEAADGKVDTRQVENGHVRIANGVMDDLIEAHLSARQFKVVLAVIRKTYGFNKKLDRISGSQLAKMTGLTRSRASLALNELIAMNIVIREGGQRSLLSYNKDSKTWVKCPKHKPPKSPGSTPPSVHNLGTLTKAHKVGTLKAECSQSDNTECSQSGTTQKTVQTVEVEADASTSDRLPKSASNPRGSSAPRCPHEQLVDLWGKHFPDAPQPQSISDRRKEHITSGWQHVWKIRHRRSGKPMYQHYVPEGETWTDREGGILWWDKFMGFIAEHCPFMTEKMRTFDIEWLFWPGNIDRTMDGRYSGPVQDDRGGARHGHR